VYTDLCESNFTKAVDLDPEGSFNQYKQNVSITENGLYLLRFYWLAPVIYPVGKKFKVTFNNTELQNITCNTSNYEFQKE